MKSRLNSILQIGDRPDDPHDVTLMHHFLVSMGVFMSLGGAYLGKHDAGIRTYAAKPDSIFLLEFFRRWVGAAIQVFQMFTSHKSTSHNVLRPAYGSGAPGSFSIDAS